VRYLHLLIAVAGEIWAMEPDKMAAAIELLGLQATGIKFDAEEIEARIAPQTLAAVARREGAVQVVPFTGIVAPRASLVGGISSGPGFNLASFGTAFDAAVADDQIKAIVLDVDSPGGNVVGTEEMAARIMAARGAKPIIAQVSGMNASAAYWVTSAADEIVATPTSTIGAIGVRTAYDDIAKKLEAEGVTREIIAAGKYKGEGLLGPLSDDTRAHLQGRVEEYYGMFVDRVAQGRGVASSAVRDGFGEGRAVSSKTALGMGMIDRIGTMAETLNRLGVQQAPPSGAAARARRERALALATI